MSTAGNQPEDPGAAGTGAESEATDVDQTVDEASAPEVAAAEPASAQNSTEELLDQAEAKLAEALDVGGERPVDAEGQPQAAAQPFDFEVFSQTPGAQDGGVPLAALQDVELDIRIELGRTQLMLDDVVKLKEGSVVPLDKLAGDPVDVLVNGRLIARGEVLVLNDNFCVRVAEILAPEN